jgi:CRP-like cAMP-binding protein
MGSMAEANTPLPLTASRSEQIFPTLTSEQIARVAKHGRTPYSSQRRDLGGTWGQGHSIFFVVISGELEGVRPTGTTETLLSIVRAGQFTGEISILSGHSANGAYSCAAKWKSSSSRARAFSPRCKQTRSGARARCARSFFGGQSC